MRIRFTTAARRQFLAAMAFIADDKPSAARRYRAKAEKSLRKLGRFPNSGRTISEFPELPFRELVIGSHRYFYRVEGKTVWIVAVWHGAQSPKKPSEPTGS